MGEAHEMIALRVGERLKHLRGGRTQSEFAEVLGIGQVQYNRYETGKRLAPDRVLERAALACGITPEEVVWGPAPRPAGGGEPADVGAAVASLVRLLDQESLTDLYYFLQRKTEDLTRRRHQEVRQALEVLRQGTA
ncbi:MAG: helix-turn-helix transcriptional regulator [Pseudomonadota bacterium]